MDNGTLALILSPLAIIITGFVTQWVTRRNHRDDTDISGFQANLNAYAARAKYAEERADSAEKRADTAEEKANGVAERMNAVETRLGEVEEVQHTQARQIVRMRNIVRDWFKQLKAWDKVTPMPLPSKEDRELLGITEEDE